MRYNQLTTQQFIDKAKQIHGDKYDYSKVNYVNNRTKVCIICPEHGEFYQTPYLHLSGSKCPKCSHRSYAYTREEFIKEVEEIFPNKFEFNLLEYKNNSTKVKLVCKKHNEIFEILPLHILRGTCGCKKCIKEERYKRLNLGVDKFVDKARQIYGDKYDYSKVEYINNKTKVCIICPEHGEFLVTPFDHIYRSSGCKLCKKSLLESKFEDFLTRKNITYIYACDKKHFKWLGRQHLDFYLPDYNIAVECQGEQHFVPKDFFGGEEGLIKRKKLDDEKYEKCKENGITLLYFYENNKFEKENNETIKKILEHDNKNRNY